MRTDPALPAVSPKQIQAGHFHIHSSEPQSQEPLCHLLSWRSSRDFLHICSGEPQGSKNREVQTAADGHFLEWKQQQALALLGLAAGELSAAAAGQFSTAVLDTWGWGHDLALHHT